jgi:dihydrofolate reductase
MKIISRMAMSADGYVTNADRWPAQIADPVFSPGESHGIPEFLVGKEAALMGRTTFEPALGGDRWPWPNLKVYVLGSKRPEGTPEDVVVESDPGRLLAKLREDNEGGDVHLIGGPATIETYRALGALDRLELVVLPLFLGGGMHLTPALSTNTNLDLVSQRPIPGGSVEIVYDVNC